MFLRVKVSRVHIIVNLLVLIIFCIKLIRINQSGVLIFDMVCGIHKYFFADGCQLASFDVDGSLSSWKILMYQAYDPWRDCCLWRIWARSLHYKRDQASLLICCASFGWRISPHGLYWLWRQWTQLRWPINHDTYRTLNPQSVRLPGHQTNVSHHSYWKLSRRLLQTTYSL